MKTAVEHLAEAIEVFTEESKVLRVSLEEEHARTALERVRTRRSRWLMLAALVCVLVVASTCAVLLVQSRARGVKTRELVSVVAGCTTPGQPCYEQGQQREKDAIGRVTSIGAVIASCSRTATTDKDLSTCIDTHLEK